MRIVALTDLDLEKKVEEGKFRSDPYYRLSLAFLQTAPLRDRREDIPALAVYFLRRKAERDQEKPPGISREAMEILSRHDWPGNTAEPAGRIEKAANLCREGRIRPEHLPDPTA